MSMTTSSYHYPLDIKLKKNTLSEAWLEIRWEMQDDKQLGIRRDLNFEIALGTFSKNVREEFPTRVALDASRIPPEMLPYIVRYQFRATEDSWPIFQFGPGVASVNFTEPYNWTMFKEKSLYLRAQLVEAYEQKISTQAVFLRYRNAIPFNYSSKNLMEFLSNSLNISIKYPSLIPGIAGKSDTPSDINSLLVFNLKAPEGKGSIRIATGQKIETSETSEPQQVEAIIFELEVNSTAKDAPSLTDEKIFEEWLNLAHLAIHDWYFSLIEGEIREQLEKEGE